MDHIKSSKRGIISVQKTEAIWKRIDEEKGRGKGFLPQGKAIDGNRKRQTFLKEKGKRCFVFFFTSFKVKLEKVLSWKINVQ